MTWEYFYERYDNWSDSTLKQRISALESTGSVDEVCEVADFAGDDEIGDKLVRKCLCFGMKVTFESILEFDGVVSEEVMDELVQTAIHQNADLKPETIPEFDGLISQESMDPLVTYALKNRKSFTAENIYDLDGLVDQDLLDRAALTIQGKLSEDDLLSLDGIVSEEILEKLEERNWPTKDNAPEQMGKAPVYKEKKHPFLGALGFLGMLGEKKDTAGPNFHIGDHVRVRYRGQEGTVVDINGSLIMVSLDDGQHVDSYSASELEKAW